MSTFSPFPELTQWHLSTTQPLVLVIKNNHVMSRFWQLSPLTAFNQPGFTHWVVQVSLVSVGHRETAVTSDIRKMGLSLSICQYVLKKILLRMCTWAAIYTPSPWVFWCQYTSAQCLDVTLYIIVSHCCHYLFTCVYVTRFLGNSLDFSWTHPVTLVNPSPPSSLVTSNTHEMSQSDSYQW